MYVCDCAEELSEATDICSGKYQLVYIGLEVLLTKEHWRDMPLSTVYRINLVGLVVNEAHCVKKW